MSGMRSGRPEGAKDKQPRNCWTGAQKREFWALYELHPEFWDSTHENYRDKSTMAKQVKRWAKYYRTSREFHARQILSGGGDKGGPVSLPISWQISQFDGGGRYSGLHPGLSIFLHLWTRSLV